ncbi:unnamed protein product [Nezara viridula]|uniref:Uncharacterized protein n=1 Tax=Nezara viridula TaxID=85310 RepID=A0A9P0H9I1_NEZVI|nr:unnamed protein product [Nezara viridula]
MACCFALVSSDLPPSGWVHYRPQAVPPHAVSVSSYRANLPAYYLLPPPPPLPVLPQAAPVLPLPQAAPALPLPPPVPFVG